MVEVPPNYADGPVRVLIAGATGYVGKYVTQEFKRRGYQVRVLTRSGLYAV